MTTADRLREVRCYLCLAIHEVASETGIARHDLEAIEDGVRSVDDLELKRLADLYEHPAEYFRSPPAVESPAGLLRPHGELTDHDRAELLRFSAYLQATTGH